MVQSQQHDRNRYIRHARILHPKDTCHLDMGLDFHEEHELRIRIVEMPNDSISRGIGLEKGRINLFPDEIMTDVVKVRIILPVKHISC